MSRSIDHKCMVVLSFNDNVFYFCPGEFSAKIVEAVVFFEIEARDEAVHPVVVIREVTVDLVNVVEDGVEVAINASVITSMKAKLTKRRHCEYILTHKS